ncbi:MAG: hypothetical protein QUS11_06670 [Candidatus Fermentibacter sp.]|nr:hypothetical protein [Candidatus Fermentibacter sp.]
MSIELRVIEPLSLQAMYIPCRIVEVYDSGSGIYRDVLIETENGHRAVVEEEGS